MPVKRRQNLVQTDRASYYNKEDGLEENFDGKGAFFNGNESDDLKKYMKTMNNNAAVILGFYQ